uniref:Methyltransf_11 domain-containing protein n=1 Tax=Heterorhabditis bacteriophora TaxID=37862 RepID=A0A1I7X678_HETBA
MSEFPSIAYSNAQKGWIGKEHIVLPTVLHAINYGQLINNKRVLDVGCGTDPRITFYHKSITDYSMKGFHVAVALFVLQFIMNKDDLLKVRLAAMVLYQNDDTNSSNLRSIKNVVLFKTENTSKILKVNYNITNNCAYAFFRFKNINFQIEWLSPVISDDGKQLYGESFFETYLNPPKDIILRAYKSK